MYTFFVEVSAVLPRIVLMKSGDSTKHSGYSTVSLLEKLLAAKSVCGGIGPLLGDKVARTS